jgi:hypothetical protein
LRLLLALALARSMTLRAVSSIGILMHNICHWNVREIAMSLMLTLPHTPIEDEIWCLCDIGSEQVTNKSPLRDLAQIILSSSLLDHHVYSGIISIKWRERSSLSRYMRVFLCIDIATGISLAFVGTVMNNINPPVTERNFLQVVLQHHRFILWGATQSKTKLQTAT